MIVFEGLSKTTAHALRTGPDAYGNAPERHISTGQGTPCRHCLSIVPKGAPYLLLSHRPFATPHAYAETGPIFICADECAPRAEKNAVPDIISLPNVILRGYDRDERIIGGTGAVVARGAVYDHAAMLLDRPELQFVDMRSASNNCWLCRIRRG